ncbi:MAG: GspH/FimT family pseudopilin [Xanthomonadaceae bacterium]|nr:GspH/FimT family pseudopilin [Xanthomonadaceae bacterium]
MACVLAVLSILGGIAGPSMYKWRQRAAADGLISALTTDIALARITAISRGSTAVLCPSHDANGCDGAADWRDGWIVFLDANRDRSRQPEEELLSVAQARRIPALGFASTSGRRTIRLFPSGMAYGSNLTVTSCLDGNTHARLVMNNVGRVRVERPRAPVACPSGAPTP